MAVISQATPYGKFIQLAICSTSCCNGAVKCNPAEGVRRRQEEAWKGTEQIALRDRHWPRDTDRQEVA